MPANNERSQLGAKSCLTMELSFQGDEGPINIQLMLEKIDTLHETLTHRILALGKSADYSVEFRRLNSLVECCQAARKVVSKQRSRQTKSGKQE